MKQDRKRRGHIRHTSNKLPGFSGPVNCVKDLMLADFQFRSPYWRGLSSIASMVYLLCKKLLLNIELAVKIGSRLIERSSLLDSLRRWSEKVEGHDRSTDSRDNRHATTGKSEPTFGIEKLKGIAVRDSMKLLLLRWFQLS